MKKLNQLILFIITLSFSIFTPFLNKAYAVSPPSVDISPSSTLYPFQNCTVNVSLCSTGNQVHIELFEDGAWTAFEGEWVQRNSDGTASVKFGGLREIRSYTVKVNCGGEIFEYVSKITIVKFTGTITLRHEQTQPNSARIFAEGCPPDSKNKFEYKKVTDLTFKDAGFGETTDASGIATFSLNAAGDYVVKTSCGGITSSDYIFTITNDGSTHVFPTQPVPPKPPCKNLSEGKCLSVETAIGIINTNGAEILYSIFVILLSMSGGIMVIIIIYAGYLLMTSRGNPEQIQKAREMLIAAITGFLFIVFSYVILGVITTDILRLPGFG